MSDLEPKESYKAVAIVGPTAVGKSDVADALAHLIGSEVISCDAMQVYRGMDIGTAKMKPEECSAPLKLVDIVDPDFAYSAALYQGDARTAMASLSQRGLIPVLCGGTGLYFKAALDVMEFPKGEIDDSRRKAYQELVEKLGPSGMHKMLEERDPASAAVIHPNNIRRVIRALEMADDGVSYAIQKAQFAKPREYRHALWIGLTMNRERLYQRINQRVDLMFDAGLVEEVEGLVDAGYASALTSMQAIGYKEVIEALDGQISLEEARDLIKMRSRRYAKRQLSWFKRDARVHWFDMDRCLKSDVIDSIVNILKM